MSYGDYLRLDAVLGAQAPLSSAHDELLFIVQHQTSELWMKLALHELRVAAAGLEGEDIRPCFKMFTRVARIFEQLNSAWDVLRTMTPSDYLRFRDSLQKSSGFQSYQYREIEFLVGNKNPVMLQPHAHNPEIHGRLMRCLEEPSLYDRVTFLLARRGFDIAPELLDRDWTEPHISHPSLREAWRQVYSDPASHWQLYELAEKLVDFEDYFRRWRFNHLLTVERIIGSRRGTGGTSGVGYLDRMLHVVLFPELWEVRADLSSSDAPEYGIKDSMFFSVRTRLVIVFLAACGTEDSGPVPVEDELPGHNECLPAGEVMSAETCLAVVEHDGRQPTTSSNVTGIAPDPDDPRLDDPEYQWLTSEIERCTCVCCHKGSYGGPGVHRWNLEHAPVWIDSANDWTLSVLVGDTEEYDQTLPTEEPERLRAVIDRQLERRGY